MPDAAPGSFVKAFQGMHELHAMGFPVSLARQMEADEEATAVERAYRDLFVTYGLPTDTRIVPFPDFGIPDSNPQVPDGHRGLHDALSGLKRRAGNSCARSARW